MTITYRQVLPGVNVPKLHRVVYSRVYNDVQYQYQKSYRDMVVRTWLKENCQHPYYHSPGYIPEKFIEFECDEDATLFALRWA